jgi:hypothetical protein
MRGYKALSGGRGISELSRREEDRRQAGGAPHPSCPLLGNHLVPYKDRSGRHGLMQEFCLHRDVNLLWGIPEDVGLRAILVIAAAAHSPCWLPEAY